MGNAGLWFGVGIPNAIWIALFIYIFTHPDVAAKWGSILSRIFASFSKRAERATVALDIQGRINRFSKNMNSEIAGILPYGIKIDWVVGETTRKNFIEEGKVIVRMNYHSNQDENIVNAAMKYTIEGLVPESRIHVADHVMKAASLICTKKLLENERKTALPFYYTEVLGPARRSAEEIDRYVLTMQSLDEIGYFTNILLYELQNLGVKMQFLLPKESVKEETKRFLDFLDAKVVKKPQGIDVDPTFDGEAINTSIVYVSRREWIGPHLRWIRKCIKKEIKTIYICAWGASNISLVKKLENRLESNPRLIKVFSKEFHLPLIKGRRKDNICIKYDICGIDEQSS